MVRQSKPWETYVQLAIATVAVVVTSDVPAKAEPIMPLRPLVLANCRSTELLPPTEAEIEALQALILTYQVSVPRLKPSGATTRCEFAHALELTIERLSALLTVRSGSVSREAIETANQLLFKSYHTEVTSQLGIDDKLAAPSTRLACQSFSTTTKLVSSPPFFTGISPCARQRRTPLTSQRSDTASEGNLPPTQHLPITSELSNEWTLEFLPNEPFLQRFQPNSKLSDIQALQASEKRYACIFGFSKSRIDEPEHIEFAEDRHVCIDQLEELTGRQEQQQAFEADFLATLKLPAIKFRNESPLKPKPFYIRTEPTPPNAGKLAALADFQALAPVIQRYGCLVGFFDQFSDRFRTYKLTRFEFAAALNNCVDRVNELVVGGSVIRQEDLLTLKQLEAAYSGELAVLRFRIDALEARIKKQEQQPFSPTTKLHIETTLELSGTAFGNR